MVRNGGSDSANGGGFDRGVSGMSTNGAATSATGTAPVFSSASYNFVSGDVNAWIYIKSGTNWTPGWYRIDSVNSNVATLDASIGGAQLDDGGLTTVAGCATTASPTGATWSIDYSRQDANQVVYTDVVINAGTNTNATSAAHPFTINQVGNIWTVIGGTGFTVQRVTMVSLSGVTATFDKSLGTLGSTGGSMKVGGAFALPGIAGSVMVASNWLFVKYNATAYTTTSSGINVSGGSMTLPDGASYALPSRAIGFDVVPGDQTGNRPTIKYGVASGNELFVTGHYDEVSNFILNGNTTGLGSNGTGVYCNGLLVICRRIKFTDFGSSGANMAGFTGGCYEFIDCEFTSCSGSAAARPGGNALTMKFHSCVFHDNTTDAYKSTAGSGAAEFVNCIFDTNKSGAAKHGIWTTGSAAAVTVINCAFYNQGLDGIRTDSACPLTVINCIFESNGGYGINPTASWLIVTLNCAYYNNSSGKYPASRISSRNISGEVIPTATVFTNAASHDFSLNNTAAGGALLRAAGFPATFPSGLTASYLAIGAAQPANTAPATFAGVFAG